MRFLVVSFTAILVPNMSSATTPLGDSQGKVGAVRIQNTSSGANSFRVYFSSVENDRFRCLQNDGYITVRENGTAVSAASYRQMYSMALTALASGKVLALDSSGASPCVNVNTAMILDR